MEELLGDQEEDDTSQPEPHREDNTDDPERERQDCVK